MCISIKLAFNATAVALMLAIAIYGSEAAPTYNHEHYLVGALNLKQEQLTLNLKQMKNQRCVDLIHNCNTFDKARTQEKAKVAIKGLLRKAGAVCVLCATAVISDGSKEMTAINDIRAWSHVQALQFGQQQKQNPLPMSLDRLKAKSRVGRDKLAHLQTQNQLQNQGRKLRNLLFASTPTSTSTSSQTKSSETRSSRSSQQQTSSSRSSKSKKDSSTTTTSSSKKSKPSSDSDSSTTTSTSSSSSSEQSCVNLTFALSQKGLTLQQQKDQCYVDKRSFQIYSCEGYLDWLDWVDDPDNRDSENSDAEPKPKPILEVGGKGKDGESVLYDGFSICSEELAEMEGFIVNLVDGEEEHWRCSDSDFVFGSEVYEYAYLNINNQNFTIPPNPNIYPFIQYSDADYKSGIFHLVGQCPKKLDIVTDCKGSPFTNDDRFEKNSETTDSNDSDNKRSDESNSGYDTDYTYQSYNPDAGTGWIGDGYCDFGSYDDISPDPALDCAKFDYDGGDCAADCFGVIWEATRGYKGYFSYYLGDGECDALDFYPGDVGDNPDTACAEWNFDGGDCYEGGDCDGVFFDSWKAKYASESVSDGEMGWLGDGTCDNVVGESELGEDVRMRRAPNLNCSKFDYDGGDCL